MSIQKFTRYFSNSLIMKEAASDTTVAPPPPVADESVAGTSPDEAALMKTFDNESGKSNLDNELSNITLSPDQKADILRRADKYSDNISKIILPILRKLHDDIVSGVFASIAPDIKGISGINEDLASLAESLRGRTRDAVLKSDKVEKK